MTGITLDKNMEHLFEYSWWNLKGYACAWVDGKKVLLHHLVIGHPPEGKEVDHINNDKLDNRVENLRFVTHAENLKNRKAYSNSGYKYVYFSKRRATMAKPYLASISREGKQINLGWHTTADDANRTVQNWLAKVEGDNIIYQEVTK